MEKRTKGCLWIGLGLAVVVVMVVVALVAGAGFWAYQSFAPSSEMVDQTKADQQFDAIRARFKGQVPLVDTDEDGHGGQLRAEGRPAFTGQLQSLNVAAYDPRAGKLVRFTVPFWLIRLGKDGKVTLGDGSLVRTVEQLTVKDLEAFGPGLLIDESKPNGDRVLVWTE